MAEVLERKEMSFFPLEHYLQVRAKRFRPFNWPETVTYKDRKYKFMQQVAVRSEGIWNGAAAYVPA
jgi:hypothetical protein